MDSGNSGSMQSSSGGDDHEEYDSRADQSAVPFQTFLNHPPTHFATLSNLHPSSLLSHQPTFFDPSSNIYLSNNIINNPFSQSHHPNANPLLNLQGLSSSEAASQSMILAAAHDHQELNQGRLFPSSSTSTMQLPPQIHDNGTERSLPPSRDHQAPNNVVVTKNPKKRTRASRRAPTTVLTTDTSNFRAMVQEFTGIPAQPFSGSSYSRGRFDLFGSAGSSLRSGTSTSHLEAMGGGIYPLRPSAQKVQSSSSSSSSINIAAASTSSNYYQLNIHDLGLQKQPINTQINQNPLLSFQSLLQHPPLHVSGNFGTAKSKGISNLPINPSVLEDQLGMSHGDHPVNANQIGGSWRDGSVGLKQYHQLRSLDHGNISQTTNSSSDFHHDKAGLEINVSSLRAQCTVDSWICPSD